MNVNLAYRYFTVPLGAVLQHHLPTSNGARAHVVILRKFMDISVICNVLNLFTMLVE